MTKPTFGWITQLVARGEARLESLIQDNERFIDLLDENFSVLWFDDHFQKDHAPLLETWTTLTYWAAKYPQYKFGTSVLAQSFRNPGMLAKMSATLQFLTKGRLIVGLGAGWKEDEYLAYNYEFPPAPERIEQLEEVAQILKIMWQQSPATFEGKHYKILNAECEPLPMPPPPLLIGGGGVKRTLKVVAKHADWMNVTFHTPEEYAHKLEVLQDHCNSVGRDFNSITKSIWIYIYLTREGKKPPPISGDRYVLYGDPDEVYRGMRGFVEAGAQHLMLRFMDFPQTDGVNLFLEEIAPRF